MPVRVQEVPTWSEFLNFTASIAEGLSGSTSSYAFRGQADAEWTLQPSLTRLALSTGLDAQTTLAVEAAALNDFQTVAHLHLPGSMIPNARDLVPWWSLMQHYGAPTRLLDWTLSPFVGAYFACERQLDRDGAVWTVHPYTVNQSMAARLPFDQAMAEANLVRPDASPLLYLPRLSTVTDRMRAQQTAFSISPQVLADHEVPLREAFGQSANSDPRYSDPRSVTFMKVIIPARLKLDFLFRLRAMNITAQSLFPGIDGLGRSVAELARLDAFRAARGRRSQ